MKIEKTEKMELNFENGLTIKDINIGDKQYELSIAQYSKDNKINGLILDFSNGEFLIMITPDNEISFHRTLHRINHDHNDSESLQVYEESLKNIQPQPFWESRFPYKGEGRKFFIVRFGSETSKI